MITLSTARFSALETRLLADLQEVRANDPLAPVVLLVPTSRLGKQLQQRLAGELGALLSVQVLTLFALAARLIENAAPGHEHYLLSSDALPELIFQSLTSPSPEPLDIEIRRAFQVLDHRPSRGLPLALAATLRDLYDSGVRADHALRVAMEGHLGAEAPEAAATIGLYARVVGTLETRALRTASDLLRRAGPLAQTSSWIAQQKGIFVYGFYDLTGVQMDLLLALSGHPKLHLYVPYDEDDERYAFARTLIDDPALQGRTRVETRGLRVGGEMSTHNPLPSSPHLSIHSCSGVRSEVWLAAKEVRRLLDEGVPAHTIAIVARGLSPYLRSLHELLPAHAIPFAASLGEPAGSHPVVKEFLVRLAARPATNSNHGDSWSACVVAALPLIPNQNPVLEELIRNALDDLRELDRLQMPITNERFLELVEAKLEGLELPARESAAAGVQVLDVQQARGLSFHTVIAFGLNEKVFPRLIREDPFLSDTARMRLSQATGCRLGRKLDGYAEEAMLFALLHDSARENLIMTFQRSDEEGKALAPSTLLRPLLAHQAPQRLPRVLHRQLEERAAMNWTPSELSFMINRAHADPLAFYAALGWESERYKGLLNSFKAIEAFRPSLSSYDGLITDRRLTQGLLERGLSPSGLESLAECPFQFFSSHILTLEPPDAVGIDGEIDPATLGKIIHKALETFFRDSQKLGLPSTEGDLEERIQAVASAAFESIIHNKPLYPLIKKASIIAVFKYLSTYLKSDLEDIRSTGFKPQWIENEIAYTLPEFGEHLASVPFHGKPDRVDLRVSNGHHEIRVVDYKTGKPLRSTGRVETHLIQGRLLQLPLYLALAQKHTKETLGQAAVSATAEMRWIRSEELSDTATPLSTDFFSGTAFQIFKENIKVLVSLIQNGHFFIEPSEGAWGYCGTCPYSRICRKEHMRTRTRSELDPVRVKTQELLSRVAPSEGGKEKGEKQ